MDFKLLALLANGRSRYIKNLSQDTLYQFTNDYHFHGIGESVTRFQQIAAITPKSSFPQTLHNIELANGKTLDVHISAILGKNGSGKSSLLELIYLLVFCFAEKQPYLQLRKSVKRQMGRGGNQSFLTDFQQEIEEILATAKLSVFYLLDSRYYVLSNSGKKVQLYELIEGKWKPIAYKASLAFYTICINYSLYGLNSKGKYFWLDPLFHKNDGYRTPLVLNPFRKQGVIDVNIEAHLAQTRVLTNLTDRAFQAGKLIGDKEIDHIEYTVVPSRIGRIGIWDIAYIHRETLATTKVNLINVLESFIERYLKHLKFDFGSYTTYLETELSKKKEATKLFRFEHEMPVRIEDIRPLLVKYCVTKIAKICMNYERYREVSEFRRLTEDGPGLWIASDSKMLVDRLLTDDSHVTLKLKQAVNALGYNYFGAQDWHVIRDPENIEQLNYRCSIDLRQFTEMVNKAFDSSPRGRKRLPQFVPTAFYVPAFKLRSAQGSSEFEQLSSGEQQVLHSIHAIVYHLLNLETLGSGRTYRAVNLILDEIELYYHPEYQRTFIQTLLNTLSRLHLETISAINVIFSTHSPFILSDIPSISILKLREGSPEKSKETAITFGGNIHEMLADVFFLNNELVGEFARRQIEERIAYMDTLRRQRDDYQSLESLTIHTDQEMQTEIQQNAAAYRVATKAESESRELYRFIQTIGEPVIRFKLLEMYDDLFPAGDDRREAARRVIEKLLLENNLTKDDI